MDKFGNKLSKENSQDFLTLSRRIAHLKEKLASLGPESYSTVKAKLESIEKTLGLNSNNDKNSKDLPCTKIKDLVKNQIPAIGEKLDFLDHFVGFTSEKGKTLTLDEKKKKYPEKWIPRLGQRLDILENYLGLEANEKPVPYSTIKEIVKNEIPEILKKIDFLETFLGISEKTFTEDQKNIYSEK